jgi:cytochrome c oxidase accessory protein FixG
VSSLIKSPGRVLPTLNQDGSRRLIRPRTYAGRFYRQRLWLGWLLILTFCSLPFVRVANKPVVLLDIAARQFTFFGHTFLATDGVLLMFLLLSIFVGVFLITALLGRGWCGWTCPQTVYMEFLFRPIENLIEGGRAGVLKRDNRQFSFRRVIKNLVFTFLAVGLGNVLLAYFVGTDKLLHWVTLSPTQHPNGFLAMAATSGLVLFDFGYFREQMCTVLCPYARLQAALLDNNSLIIGYDAKRGEPRRKRASGAQGDCVDCGACQIACPTGIDIRDGLQLECIACAQCVDACDSIMTRLHKPLGLIRYSSKNELAGNPRKLLRPRTLIYPAVLVVLLSALVWSGGKQSDLEVTVLRGTGAPFVVDPTGVRNQLQVRVRNRTGEAQTCAVSLDTERLILMAPQNPFTVDASDLATTTVFVTAPPELVESGVLPIVVRVQCGSATQAVPYKLLGPKRPKGAS